MQTENVIPLNIKSKTAIFTPELRETLERGSQTFTDKPTELVTHLEQIICTWLVAKFRALATKAGTSLGKRIAS